MAESVYRRLAAHVCTPSSTRERRPSNKECIMNISQSLLAAAVGGILVGAAGHAEAKSSSSSIEKARIAATSIPMAEGAKHACKGKNSCKGQGGCKTDKHDCKGQNACKG